MTSDPPVPPEPVPPPVSGPTRPPAAKSARTPTRVAQPKPRVPFTRVSAAWWALIVGTLILIVLLIFIAQNLDSTSVRFLGWEWQAPVGIAFLVAAICGALITVMTGAARMVQLRRAAKKNLHGGASPPPKPDAAPR